MNRALKFFKKLFVLQLITVICFDLGVGPHFASIALTKKANAKALPNPHQQPSALDNEYQNIIGRTLIDPGSDFILNNMDQHADWADDVLSFVSGESQLDQDPFFLRSQSWHQSETQEPTSDYEFSTRLHSSRVDVLVPGTNMVWSLKQKLTPILATDSYIFLSARAEANIFQNIEGLFFVKTNELIAASAVQDEIPVYFLPMVDKGWTTSTKSQVRAEELPQSASIVFTNSNNESYAIAQDDIALTAKVENINLKFATLAELNKRAANLKITAEQKNNFTNKLKSIVNLAGENSLAKATTLHEELLAAMTLAVLGAERSLLPAPRSTSNFGMFYVAKDRQKLAATSGHFIQLLRSLFLPNLAHANTAGDDPVSLAIAKMTRIGIVCAATFFAGILFRHTILKAKIKKIDETLGREERSRIRAYFDIFAHSSTVLSQVPSVWGPNISQNILDRILPRIGIRQDHFIRRFFNKTFGFSKATSDKTPVNANTFVIGAIILGGIDVALVGLQLYFIIPAIAHFLAYIAPFDFIDSRVLAAYSTGNASIALYSLISLLRNFIGYITSGAYTYAHQVQEIVTNQALRTVKRQMELENKNADLPIHKSEYDERVKAIVRAEFKKNGLPADEEFLFDANTLYANMSGFFGYKAPEGFTEDNAFLALRSPGLVAQALKRAYKRAKTCPDCQNERLGLLNALNDFSTLRGILAQPSRLMPNNVRSVAKKFTQVREELVALSLEQAVSATVAEKESLSEITKQTLPASWLARFSDETSAHKAAKLFQQELHTLNFESYQEKSAEQKSEALEIANQDPLANEGRYAKYQIRKAMKQAQITTAAKFKDKIATYGGYELALNADSEIQDFWNLQFQRALVNTNGIYPEYEENSELIAAAHRDAEASLESSLKNKPQLAAYLQTLTPFEQRRIRSIMYADFFTLEYVKYCNDEMVNETPIPALDPAQHGTFQKLRQKKWVRNSKLATKMLRSIEGIYSDSRYQRGFYSRMVRDWIPIIEDARSGTQQQLRRFPVALIFGYTYSLYLWNTVLPMNGWLLEFLLAGPFINGPWTSSNRVMSKLGLKPGIEKMSMAVLATVGSFFTMWGMLVYGLFSSDFNNAINAAVQAGQSCVDLLKGQ